MYTEEELRDALSRVFRQPAEDIDAGVVSALSNEDSLEAAVTRAVNLSDAQPVRSTIAYYQVFLGRLPDADGLTFNTNVLRDTGSLSSTADDFVLAPEFQAVFSNLPVNDVVLTLYQNVLGRNPLENGADVEGFNFWVNVTNTRIQQFLAENGETDADGNTLPFEQQPADIQLAARNEALARLGEDFANAQETTQVAFRQPTNDVLIAAGLEGDDAFDPNDELVGDPSNSQRLTVDVDVLTGTNEPDVFEAPLARPDGQTDTQTLNSTDELDGGLGTDRLNARLIDANTGPETAGIEQFFLRATAPGVGNQTLDAALVTGATEFWNDRSTQSLAVTNIGNAVAAGLNMVDAQTSYNLIYDNGASDGSQVIALQGAGNIENDDNSDAVTVISTDGGEAITDVTIAALGGENNIRLAGDMNDVETLTASGDAPLIVNTVDVDQNLAGDFFTNTDFASLEMLMAGDFNGGLELSSVNPAFAMAATGSGDDDLDFSASTVEDLSVVTGAGDDELTVNRTLLIEDANDDDPTFDLGDGEDNLEVTDVTTGVRIGNLFFGDTSGVDQLTLVDDIALAADAELDIAGTPIDMLDFMGGLNLAGFGLAIAEDGPTALDAAFHGGVTGAGSLDFGDATDVDLTFAGAPSNVVIDGTSRTLGNVSIDASDDLTVEITGDDAGDETGSIDMLAIDDTSVDADENPVDDSSIAVTLTDTPDLGMIDLNGGEDTEYDVDATGAGFGGPVDILIGSIGPDGSDDDTLDGAGNVEYFTTANNGARENFIFDGDDIGDVMITGFTSGVGGNADRLDFSQFGGNVNGLEDLTLAFAGGNTTVDSDEFTGTITIVGNDITDDSANFLFA